PAAVEAGDTGQPGDRHPAHVRRLLHEQPAVGFPEDHHVRKPARQLHGGDGARPGGGHPGPLPGPLPDGPDAVLHARNGEGAEKPMSEKVSERPPVDRRKQGPASPAPARSTRTPLGWWRNPWRRPHILASVTWVYLAWSLLPVFIAIGISFNSGRSNSVWQGFSTQWWWGHPESDPTGALFVSPELHAALIQSLRLSFLTMFIAVPIGVAL